MRRASQARGAPCALPGANDPSLQDFGSLDQALRRMHAHAATHLSTRTRTQLHHRVQAALASAPTAARPASHWRLALACSIAMTILVGMQWHAHQQAQPATGDALATGGADTGEFIATLDETPDLYVWLASDDAHTLAAEARP